MPDWIGVRLYPDRHRMHYDDYDMLYWQFANAHIPFLCSWYPTAHLLHARLVLLNY